MIRMFARRFYAMNTGFFVFLFVIMFGIIETISGDNQMILTYHYRLILGMLSNDKAFLILLFAWLLYAGKCFSFIAAVVTAPEASFLFVLNTLDRKTIFLWLLSICVLLYLPVFAYSLVVAWVAFRHHFLIRAVVIVAFQIFVCLGGARYFQQQTRFWGHREKFFVMPAWVQSLSRPYFSFLLTGIFRKTALLFTGIKMFSCLLLFMFLRNLDKGDYDFRFMMMFFLMACLGHALIIHRTRRTEETLLAFYRRLPLSRWHRWIQYSLFYFILLIPELLVICYFIPVRLYPMDGVLIFLFAWSFLLFQHAVLSVSLVPVRRFFQIMLLFFMLQFLFIADGAIMPLIILQIISATGLFIGSYYLFELKNGIAGEG